MSRDATDDLDARSTTDPEVDAQPSDGSDSGADTQSDDITDPRADDYPEIEDGRYLYCLVKVDDPETGDGQLLEVTGIDGESLSVVTEAGIGAVVHECDSLYDSADLAQIRRWLVRHQTVVDAAGEAFGTPIPFQFDTVFRGGDDRLEGWLREERSTLEQALDGLAGHWEYRIEVVDADPVDDETLIERDERLQELQAKIDEAGEGTAFLLEKRRDQRLEEVRAARRESIAGDLEARLSAVAREVHALERSPSVSLDDESGERAGDEGGGNGDATGETCCRFTVLAHETDESAVGAVLDEFAAMDGLEIRFTGPWPPYTFAPELGGPGEERESPETGPSHSR
ncbi:gas vesicle protein GvpL [Natrarchaeobaculum aegyptiacum]|uniref:Gas vesicle protein GvpFL n=1 Tax=Natrarchaeobaculum aegyptiacum TaxID=745377 RepID=A0A2Z2HNI0_9EURY|nr:GvpL/GvpF family gas vesicle protein [Natrarchaeobaculum aegyptiacum]ARS88451.1 gas vesicle protein GvpFL [Natrarchaeobaculum aegyptiacum]